jgi:hypothetical protein
MLKKNFKNFFTARYVHPLHWRVWGSSPYMCFWMVMLQVTHADFKKAKEKVMYKKKEGVPEGLYM